MMTKVQTVVAHMSFTSIKFIVLKIYFNFYGYNSNLLYLITLGFAAYMKTNISASYGYHDPFSTSRYNCL